MADLARIKRNVAKMAEMGAPEADIDGYIASEGATVEEVRAFQPNAQAAPPTQPPAQQQIAPSTQQAAPTAPQIPFGAMNPLDNPTFRVNAIEAVPIVGPYLRGAGETVEAWLRSTFGGGTYEEEKRKAEQTNDMWKGAEPVSAALGATTGTVAPFVLGGGIPAVARVLGMSGGLGSQIGFGAVSGAGITAADTLARGGSMKDAFESAAWGGGLGGGLPLALKAAGRGIGMLTGQAVPRVTRPVKQIAKALRREGIGPRDVQTRMAALGPQGMLADLGPNPARQASTIASMPGEGQAIVRANLTRRAEGANQRIRDTLDNELGPSPIPSMEQASIRAQQEALSPQYEALFPRARPVDVTPIVRNLEGNIAITRGETQRFLERLRPMFNNHGTQNLTASPRVLMEVRKAIDGMFEGDMTRQTRGILGHYRQMVDAELARTVPGIKAVDAQFEELARQNGALDRGGQVLSSGPEAPWPVDLAAEMATGTQGVQMRIRQGTRALLERIVGNNANDLQALRRLVKGEGDWNRDRLVTIFGAQRAQAIINILENEAQFARTNALVQQGPETAARLAGQRELGDVNVTIPSNVTMTGIGANLASRGVNAALNMNSGATNRRMAELLTMPGLPPEVVAALQQALQGPRRLPIAPAAAPLLGNTEQKPLRITVPY